MKSCEERAAALLKDLSLDEKMAQVGCIFPFGELYKNMDWIWEQTSHGIGQVSTLEMRRMESLEEVSAWQRAVQKTVMENSPHHISAVFHMEGLCGAFIQGAASFPSGIARGLPSTWIWNGRSRVIMRVALKRPLGLSGGLTRLY